MTSTRSAAGKQQESIPAPKPDLTPRDMIESAIALRPLLREKQAETEAARRILDEVNQRCIEAGFYRALQPRRFGGYEFDLPTFARTMIEVSRGCPSTGWVVTFTAGHTHVLSKLPLEVQTEVYGKDGEFRAPLSGASGATARKVDGGYLLNGGCDYASGIDVATHFFASCTVRDSEDSPPGPRLLALVDRSQFEIEDNWQMLGMQGTGSKRAVFKDVFVPAARVSQRNPLIAVPTSPQARLFSNPMYAGPSINILMAEIAAVAIGTGWAALDCFEDILRRRMAPPATTVLRQHVAPGPPSSRAEDREFQVYYGNAAALLETAEAALLGSARQYMDCCRDDTEGRRPFTAEMSQRIVLVDQQCCRLAGEAMNLIFRMSGTSEARPGRMMQRYYRDMATLLTHVTLAYERNYEQLARTHFGLA